MLAGKVKPTCTWAFSELRDFMELGTQTWTHFMIKDFDLKEEAVFSKDVGNKHLPVQSHL